jgi:hypothetical protein
MDVSDGGSLDGDDVLLEVALGLQAAVAGVLYQGATSGHVVEHGAPRQQNIFFKHNAGV